MPEFSNTHDLCEFIRFQEAIIQWYAQEPPLWKIVSRIRWKKRRPTTQEEKQHER